MRLVYILIYLMNQIIMRKISLLITVLFAIVFIRCEKSESTEQAEKAPNLSEFIVGVWRSDDQYIDDGEGGEVLVYYTASFYNDSTYTIEMAHSLQEGGARIDTAGFTPYTAYGTYTEYGGGGISINNPDWAFDSIPCWTFNIYSDHEDAKFNIEWVEGTHTMTWYLLVDSWVPSLPFIIWTFWHDIDGIEAMHTLPD